MSFIDVAIPAIIGLAALVRPQIVFYGSRATPDEKKIRLVRGIGAILLVVAIIYLGIKSGGSVTRSSVMICQKPSPDGHPLCVGWHARVD